MKASIQRSCAILVALFVSLPALAHALPSTSAFDSRAQPKTILFWPQAGMSDSAWAVSAFQEGFRFGGAKLKLAFGSSKLSIGCSLEL